MEIFGINIIQTLITVGITGVAMIALDKIIKLIIFKFYPEKIFLDFVDMIDDEYIDKMKIKYPEAGQALEDKFSTTLRKMADIIQDIEPNG